MKPCLFHFVRAEGAAVDSQGTIAGGGGRAASVLLPDVMEAAKWGPLEWLESCGCRGAGRQPVARPGPGGT